MPALWGKLASEILKQDWDQALEDLNQLQEVIDSNVGGRLHEPGAQLVTFLVFSLYVTQRE